MHDHTPQNLNEALQVIHILKQENEELREKNTQLLHALYGTKSEKAPETILPEFDEPIVTLEEQTIIAEAEEEIIKPNLIRKQPKRKPLPHDFERETIIYDLPEEQKVCSCGSPLHCIGEDKSEKLEYIPAKIKVIENIRKKYGCRACESGVIAAVGLSDFLPKSIAAPGLLTHVILSKYQDHLPLYRQESIWQRLGVDIARSTLCNWVLMAAERLSVLIPLLKEEVIKNNYARADETPVQVMEENKVRTSKKAYMWVFTSGRPEQAAIIYEFAMNRSGNVATEFLLGFKGFLQTDAYSGYNEICAKEGVTTVGCWAHCRRKFVAIVKIVKKTGSAHYAVAVIQKLYKIESEIKQLKLAPDEIKDYRHLYARPIMEAFKIWLDQKQAITPPKNPLGKAIAYALNHWASFTIYLDHGILDIDNNFAERCVRPFTLGRKNWVFMGNERGGKAAAILYSLIETCKSNKLNTYYYFRYLFTEFPKINIEDKSALRALLPMYLTPEILMKHNE